MRNPLPETLEAARILTGPHASNRQWGAYGKFRLPLRKGPASWLVIVASGGDPADELSGGWEHVSVSTAVRCPTWEEMCVVKDLFWNEDEAVVQFHPPRAQYVNCHAYCLHLWKPPYALILPPRFMVGVSVADAPPGFRPATHDEVARGGGLYSNGKGGLFVKKETAGVKGQ